MPTQEYTDLFEEPMEHGAKRARRAVMTDVCNRYQADASADEKQDGKTNWVLKCEVELAEYFGHKFGLGVSSGGLAIMLGLRAMHCVLLKGAEKDDVRVYSNSFTFNAVPSAIVNAGFVPTFIQTSQLLTICTEDLERQVEADLAAGTKRGNMILVLSYMRGRIPDMDQIMRICATYGVKLLEDNAHGYGAEWRGRKMGNFGIVSTISTQANKLINTGEGGFTFTSCDRMQAFLMMSAGCYEDLFQKHGPCCPSQAAIEEMRHTVPNYSCRLSNIQAAVAHPQIAILPRRITAHNANYEHLQRLVLEGMKQDDDHGTAEPKGSIEFIPQLPEVFPVYDSLQLRLKGLSLEAAQRMIATMKKQGFNMNRFADRSNARYYRNWGYCVGEGTRFAETDAALEGVVDLRLLAHDSAKDNEKLAAAICTSFLSAREGCCPPASAGA